MAEIYDSPDTTDTLDRSLTPRASSSKSFRSCSMPRRRTAVSQETLLEELLEVLDAPEALEVYNRSKQTY